MPKKKLKYPVKAEPKAQFSIRLPADLMAAVRKDAQTAPSLTAWVEAAMRAALP